MSVDSQSRHAVGSMYVEHHGWLHAMLRKQLGCAMDAADLAQDTFERLLTRRETASWREPRAYLRTIARGLVVDLYRRRDLERAFQAALCAMPEPLAPSPEERALLLEALHAIDRMLEGLPPAAREAFLLSQLDGLTYGEIAQRLKVTERTVANYMSKAMTCCLALVE